MILSPVYASWNIHYSVEFSIIFGGKNKKKTLNSFTGFFFIKKPKIKRFTGQEITQKRV